MSSIIDKDHVQGVTAPNMDETRSFKTKSAFFGGSENKLAKSSPTNLSLQGQTRKNVFLVKKYINLGHEYPK